MTRTEIDALKARVDLVEVIRTTGVELKQSGQGFVGRCPFHKDKKPSLSVSPGEQLWQCFSCKTGGDVLSYLSEHEKRGFAAALRHLQELAGDKPEPTNGKKRPGNGAPQELPGNLSRAELLGRVAQLYHEALLRSEEAQAYLKKRGLADPELWKAFRLGYADGSLQELFPRQGDTATALAELGVVSEAGRELMRGCLVVPLEHPDRGVMNLYGRAIHEASEVPHRYLRGPKRGVLNWQALRSARRLVVAESVLDALSLWQAGVRDVTCLYGAGGLPPDLEEQLSCSAAKELVWCLDADPAGRAATADLAGQLSRFSSLVAELPEGQDPNQVLATQGGAALARLVARALPLAAPPEAALTAAQEAQEDPESLSCKLEGTRYHLTPLRRSTGG